MNLKKPGDCRQYAMCSQVPIGTIKHPILGDVPACARCVERYVTLGGKRSDFTLADKES